MYQLMKQISEIINYEKCKEKNVFELVCFSSPLLTAAADVALVLLLL